MGHPRFILPDQALVRSAAGTAGDSYSIYNYYGRGPISAAKRSRLRRALALGAKVQSTRVIDIGCGDGILLPSLAEGYSHVAAIDINEQYVARSRHLVESVGITNVQTLCNAHLSSEELTKQIGTGYQLAYLLETLEHVGQQPDIWAGKISFLKECFALLDRGGEIVISVPKMVGMIVLFKNLLQRSLGLGHDNLTWRQLLRSALFRNTDALEPLWTGGHTGFNHLKLDQHLQRSFVIHDREESAISVFYRIGQLPDD